MGSKEKTAMALILVAIAFYAFGLKALYLCALMGLIYLFSRPSRR